MTRNIISLKHDIANEPTLKKQLSDNGFTFKPADYAFWRARKDKTTITFFKSGKLLLQGDEAEYYSNRLFDASNRFEGLEHIADLQSWIGTDESGKGDFFGPLCVAAVYITRQDLQTRLAAELRDSKYISDQSIHRFAELIGQTFIHSIVTLTPLKYNQLYPKSNNLNALLGEAHAQAIEAVLKQVDCHVILSDKFGDESYIADALHEKHIRVQLIQQTRAEKNPAVAAASILARHEFLSQLSNLNHKFQIELPKGAGSGVIQAGKNFINRYGTDALKEVAKLNFKTVYSIVP
ncbi:ribonuclease HIII [candidate division KSB1 bacterium]|nr:ribonuclease HIII [candidate division KSB1 bacterium]